ncbi:hypothetical protein RJ45_25780 [Photobacterium gaetbulicola]|uniref:Uncharacterized protein n=1 Tax=Photobacterium gaetbulicola TaxID=1295392 RepID=A0A0B9FNP2_9GAMM|nr:hypothetical protein [Photobacterium gaetbulicola]KHT58053.1 hypothetical protein RJ45_25780 [Photobacterium gaetbulicola]
MAKPAKLLGNWATNKKKADNCQPRKLHTTEEIDCIALLTKEGPLHLSGNIYLFNSATYPVFFCQLAHNCEQLHAFTVQKL